MTAPTQDTLLPELPLSFGYNLDERGRREYTIGQPKAGEAEALADAMDYYHAPTGWRRDGCPTYRRDPEDLVARYMRIFWGTEVRRVSLQGHTQGDWAEGYVVLDNLAATHGPDYALSPGEAQRILASVAKEWEDYFQGDVYGFEVTDMDGFVLDSCWGFYLGEGETLEDFAKGLCYGHVDAQRVEVIR